MSDEQTEETETPTDVDDNEPDPAHETPDEVGADEQPSEPENEGAS